MDRKIVPRGTFQKLKLSELPEEVQKFLSPLNVKGKYIAQPAEDGTWSLLSWPT